MALQAKTILAESYVPHSYRLINLLPLNEVLPTRDLETLDPLLERICANIVPQNPCVCPKDATDSTKEGTSDAAIAAPYNSPHPEQRHYTFSRFHVSVPELYYALQTSHSQHVDNKLRLLKNLKSADGSAEQALLDCERLDKLLLFERYSQYNHRVIIKPENGMSAHKISSKGKKARRKHNANNANNKSDSFTLSDYATITIPGIADAEPPIRPGDHCLLRPMSPVSLPRISNQQRHMMWTATNMTVEIRARVINVARSRNGKDDKVVITWFVPPFSNTFQLVCPKHMYNVRFIPDAVNYDRCVTALGWSKSLPPKVWDALQFPKDAPLLPTHSGSEKKIHSGTATDLSVNLNKLQKQFVETVLIRTSNPSSSIRPPMILTGPAGTGKTKALLAAISKCLQVPKVRILICTPSHTACNVIAERLSTQLSLDRTVVFRLLGSHRPISSIPTPVLQYCCQDDQIGAFTIPPNRKLLQFKIIVCTCADAHLLYRAGVSNQRLHERRTCFQTWLQTSLKDSNMELTGNLEGADQPHFTHLFLDEASQATVPESTIPLSVVVDPESTRAVEIALVGDPRQLSPQVYSTEASNAGLGVPWMERLLRLPLYDGITEEKADMLGPAPHTMADFVSQAFDSKLATFLTMNYRGHPAFLMMTSALFYYDRLHSAKGFDEFENDESNKKVANYRSLTKQILGSVLRELAERVSMKDSRFPLLQCQQEQLWPIQFRGVLGKDASVTVEDFCGTNSWCNHAEARAVCEITSALTKNGVSSGLIGVMAPFRGQVVLIRRLLRAIGLSDVNVGTIEDFQAVEQPIIVLSLTRSNPDFVSYDAAQHVGAFHQPKRTNVAMTRAEEAFIVVGNPKIMLEDVVWRQWLFFCLRHGLWRGEGSSILHRFLEDHSPDRQISFLNEDAKNNPSSSSAEKDAVVIGLMERIVKNS